MTTDGNNIWVSGNSGGVAYTTLGDTISTPVETSEPNVRQLQIIDGQLYVSSQKLITLAPVGIGTPFSTANPTLTNLTGVAGNSEVTNGYFFAQVNQASGQPDTLYLTDSSGQDEGGAEADVEKYSLISGAWQAEGYFGLPGVTGVTAESLTGSVNPNTGAVTLYATTSGTGGTSGTLFSFTDSTGVGGRASGNATVIGSAGTNEAFRGLAMAPQTPTSTATHLVITAPSTVTAGQSFNFTVTPEDANGNIVPFSGYINFSTSDTYSTMSGPQVSLPGQYDFTTTGAETFSATLISAGTQTIAGGGAIFGGSNAIKVVPAAPSTVTVTAPAGVDADVAFGVTVSLEDQFGNLATNFTGNVTLSSSDTHATLPVTNYTFTAADAGTHTFTGNVLSTTGGSAAGTNQTFTADDTTNSVSGSATIGDYIVGSFTAGDIVVEQINAADNSVTPTGSASPVFISEYATTGSQSQAVQTVPIWSSTASGSTNPLTLSGTAGSEGGLSLSTNGAYLVVAGYDAAAGGKTQNNSTVGLVNSNGVVNTSTTTTLLSGNNTRSAASVNGTSVYVGGNNGVVYEATGTSLGGTLVDTSPNTREVEIAPAADSRHERQPTIRVDQQVESRRPTVSRLPCPSKLRVQRIPFSAA